MHLLASPAVAIGFGAFFLCAESCLHFQEIINPSHWTDLPWHDWFAGIFLVLAGLRSRRNWDRGKPYQAAAWAFMASLLVGALLAHWEEWRTSAPADDEWLSPEVFLAIIGGLLALAIGAVAGTLRSRGASAWTD